MAWLNQTSAPSVTAVSLSEVKANLKVLHADEDDLIAAMLDAAVAMVEGRHGVTGRALITQSWEYRFASWPGSYYIGAPGVLPGNTAYRPLKELPLPPLQSVDEIQYVDSDGNLQTLDSSVYEVVTQREPGGFRLARDQYWPSLAWQEDAVRVTFTAGYGDSANDVPAAFKQAIKLIAGHWYVHRDTVGQFDDRIKLIHRALLDAYTVRVLHK